MIGEQKIQVGLSDAGKTAEVIVEADTRRYGISSPGARSSSFLQSSTTPSSWHSSRQEGSRG